MMSKGSIKNFSLFLPVTSHLLAKPWIRSYHANEAQKNLYAILGIQPDASKKQIKDAYYRLAKIHHPDAGGEHGKFISLQEAYLTLTDPFKRKEYDQTINSQQKASSQQKNADFHEEYMEELLFKAGVLTKREAIEKRIELGKKNKFYLNNPLFSDATPLVLCIDEGYWDLALQLLQVGADPNKKSQNRTPLLAAIDKNNLSFVTKLLIVGANPNQEGYRYGRTTPLYAAIENNNLELVRLLIQAKADIYHDSGNGRYAALFKAVDGGNLAIFKFIFALHKGGNDIKAHGYTLLSTSILDKHYDIALYLLTKHHATCEAHILARVLSEKNVDDHPPELYQLLKIAVESGTDIFDTDYYSHQTSLASWALENSWILEDSINQHAEELKDSIKLILLKFNLTDDPIKKFLAELILKCKILIEQLSLEIAFKQNGVFELWHYLKYNDNNANFQKDKRSAITQLNYELFCDPLRPVSDIVHEIEKKSPQFLSGTFFHRERDLVEWIENEQYKLGSLTSKLKMR